MLPMESTDDVSSVPSENPPRRVLLLMVVPAAGLPPEPVLPRNPRPKPPEPAVGAWVTVMSVPTP